MADFNFRNKEIAVRKILGARKKQILLQLGFETLLYCFSALLLSIILIYILFPQIAENLNPNLRFRMIFEPQQLRIIVGTLLLIVVFATAYPAYQFMIHNPIHDLKRKLDTKSNLSLNKVLLIAQFSISIFCIAAAWVVGSQLRFVKTHDLGFDRRNIITMIMPDRYPLQKAPLLKSEILRVAGVEAASFSYYRPTASIYYNDWYDLEIQGAIKRMIVNEVFVDRDVFKTMGHSILEGRGFSGNESEAQTTCIVNETAVKEFGWKQPLGQRVSWGDGPEHRNATVIGVVKDFNTRSLHARIEPLIMRLQYDTWSGNCLNIKFNDTYDNMVPRLSAAFKSVLPEYLMELELVEDLYERQYRTEEKAFSTLQLGTAMIILISALGIFSLSTYISIRRMKEFGIRKVLGASVPQIAALHISKFLRLAFWANLIALPFSYWLLKEWLNNFAYRTEPGGFIFIAVAGILFALVIISTGYSTWKAGRMNPVDVIRTE